MGGIGLSLAEALSTPSFLHSLCLALAHDHKEVGMSVEEEEEEEKKRAHMVYQQ